MNGCCGGEAASLALTAFARGCSASKASSVAVKHVGSGNAIEGLRRGTGLMDWRRGSGYVDWRRDSETIVDGRRESGRIDRRRSLFIDEEEIEAVASGGLAGRGEISIGDECEEKR